VRQALHPEIVEDEERDGGDLAEVVLAGTGELGVRELIEEQRIGNMHARRPRAPGVDPVPVT
jgi:hypothetical protein